MEEKLQSKRFYLILVLLFLSAFEVKAQNRNSNTALYNDTTILSKREGKLKVLFSKLFHKKERAARDTGSISQKKAKQSDTTSIVKKHSKRILDFTKGGITWTSLYTQGVNLNTGVNGFYNIANVTQDFDVMGIPLMAQATGVMDNGEFMRSYSSYSVNFDSYKFMAALKQRAQGAMLNKVAAEKGSLPAGEKMNVEDSLKAFGAVQEKLASPSYQAEVNNCKLRMAKIEDSLSKAGDKDMNKGIPVSKSMNDSSLEKKATTSLADSLNKGTSAGQTGQDSLGKNKKADTTELHNDRVKIAEYEQLEKRYNQLFGIKKKYNNLMKDDTLGNKDATAYEKDRASLNNPDNIKKILEENKMLSPYEKFLLGFQYFTIGRSTPEMSEFTLHDFMMNGVSIGYKADNVYVSGGYGKEQAVINPYLMTGINVPDYKRTVEYARAGVGSQTSSNLYATAIRITDPGSPASLAETNWILDISKKEVLSKSFDIEGEMAHSLFKYLPNKSDSAAPPVTSLNSNNMAYAFRVHGIIPGIKTDVKAEYLNTGENYITLGNQYLLSGTKTYRLEFRQNIGKKLAVDIGGAHVLQNQTTLEGMKGTDNWVQFGIKYQPSGSVEMEMNYSPRQFQQQEGSVVANSITSNMNQLSFVSNIRNEILGDDMITTLFVGNFQYSTPQSSLFLAQNMNLSYYMLNEMLMLTSRSSLNFTGNESRSDWTGNLSQFIGEGAYTMNIGKRFTFSSGCQWIEEPGITDNAGGLIGSIGEIIGKWGRFSLQFNCRNNMDELFNMKTSQLIISTNAAIMW